MKSRHPQFIAPNPEIENRIDSILSTLTLEEKIALIGGQTNATTGVPAKGIPSFRTSDGPLGVTGQPDGCTAYPASVALAATWDRDLAYRYGQAAGRDARAVGIHFLLGPGMNITRSPLCGRNFEYLGEDPYLAGQMAAGHIRGIQDQGVSACAKHFALNFQEYNRYFVSSDIDERTLHEIYLPAFRACVEEAGVGSFMGAYNLVNGVYCSQNEHLIRDILKGDWRFDGLIMSDWDSTHDGVAAANAGLDLEMPTGALMNPKTLIAAVKDGRVAQDTLDDKVRRLLRLAICFGWLDRDQKDGSLFPHSRQSAAAALDVARAGCVLLKNEGAILPIDPKAKLKIAVIGPSSHPANTGGGGSSYVKPWHTVSILEGIREFAPQAEILFARGCDPWRQDDRFHQSTYFTPDGKPGMLGEYFNNPDLRGKPDLVRIDEKMNIFWVLDPPASNIRKEGHSIRWTGYILPESDGEHAIYFSGGDAEYRVTVANVVVFDSWGKGHTGSRRGQVKLQGGIPAEVKIEYRPVWHYEWVQFGWEHADNVLPDYDEALRIAREADVVIYCTGHQRFSESENSDRTFAMAPEAEKLLGQVSDANPNTVVVLTGGGNIDSRSWIDRVKGVLHAWYPGQEGGTAVAEILFGKVNPSGKLPASFERNLEDGSGFDSYHDDDDDKRVQIKDGIFCGYRHYDRTGIQPLFPFGFGLSYTTFEYQNLRLSTPSLSDNQTLTVTFDVVNTGHRPGAEVTQLYLRDDLSSLPRPVKELKGFAKVTLEPGQRQSVEIKIGPDALRFYDPDQNRWIAEKGTFTVFIGASSADIRLDAQFDYVP